MTPIQAPSSDSQGVSVRSQFDATSEPREAKKMTTNRRSSSTTPLGTRVRRGRCMAGAPSQLSVAASAARPRPASRR